MELTYILMIMVIVVSVAIVVLALIGLKQKKREREYLEKYNQDSIKSFMNGVKNKKYSRKTTPKVPTIKNDKDRK